MKMALSLLAAMPASTISAFAIDGQVLINQTTVAAAGGFPYTISEPGSYKLPGNLTASTAVAMLVNTSNVTLDLNGFTITGRPRPSMASKSRRISSLSATAPFRILFTLYMHLFPVRPPSFSSPRWRTW